MKHGEKSLHGKNTLIIIWITDENYLQLKIGRVNLPNWKKKDNVNQIGNKNPWEKDIL